MARMSKAEKAVEKEIEQLYYKHGNCVQVNIMDIGKIYAHCKATAAAGGTLEQGMIEAIAKYRQNSPEESQAQRGILA